MRIFIAVLALVLTATCAPVGAAPSASPVPSGSLPASSTPSASLLAGSTFTMPADRDMIEFLADEGSLIAYSSKDAPPPYDSKIQRADPATNTWRTIYQTDAMFMQQRVAAGRIALLEYREPFQGSGAFSVKVVVVDLSSGRATTVDEYALTSATYHGGGGGPRRPWSALTLGPDRIAWTRLIEGPGGSITGELEIASLTDPTPHQAIASSGEWIAPLAIDATRLVYVVGGKTEDQLHVRDVASGGDTIVARATVGNTAVVGSPGIDYAAVSGKWAVWPESATAPTAKGAPSFSATIHALDLTTRAERTFDAGGAYCPRITAGSRYFAWYCGSLAEPNPQLYDAATLQPATAVPPGVGVGAVAADDGVIWFNLVPNGRTVTLFRPRS
ncbi:MAG TPA: hypothetical protein VGS17_06655 [Candidatus Limnocylindria bacterium]|nr:hypothetical protein [Candidatus Limnocylindria bacterium]